MIALVGAGGMLGSELAKVFSKPGDCLPTSEFVSIYSSRQSRTATDNDNSQERLDITDFDSVSRLFKRLKPRIVINCAAYTAVDLAETDQEKCYSVNATGAGNLAKGCAEIGAKLVHFSTDYVFGGKQHLPNDVYPSIGWKEDDSVSPCGVYGQTKWEGECLVRKALPEEHLIIRISWLYGAGGKNFVETMLALGATKDEIGVVHDQLGSPTWTNFVAKTLIALLKRDVLFRYPTLHLTTRGGISWAEFAEEIFRVKQIGCRVKRICTEEFPRPAPRPAFSALNVERLEQLLDAPAPGWQENLTEYLENRAEPKRSC